ncbi:MAG: lipocalin family protein [Candidatus Latescibacteria bacterium]|nr:lipocalin family protein [Candidatus Latescibacterota bacterium]
MKRNIIIISLSAIISLVSCNTIPKGITAVKPFEKADYLGKWYEIARFDFRFERNLNNVTAHYSLNKDGKTIKVVNRGYDYTTNKWKEVTGKAKFVKDDTTAMLKVSFFGPFYAGYNVLAIDSKYRYALVSGSSLEYLWIFSRETSIPENIKQDYLAYAEKLGFNTANLIWVEHNNQD